jgi:hypothetical protein
MILEDLAYIKKQFDDPKSLEDLASFLQIIDRRAQEYPKDDLFEILGIDIRTLKVWGPDYFGILNPWSWDAENIIVTSSRARFELRQRDDLVAIYPERFLSDKEMGVYANELVRRGWKLTDKNGKHFGK